MIPLRHRACRQVCNRYRELDGYPSTCRPAREHRLAGGFERDVRTFLRLGAGLQDAGGEVVRAAHGRDTEAHGGWSFLSRSTRSSRSVTASRAYHAATTRRTAFRSAESRSRCCSSGQ